MCGVGVVTVCKHSGKFNIFERKNVTMIWHIVVLLS